jgi:hypothetical protein
VLKSLVHLLGVNLPSDWVGTVGEDGCVDTFGTSPASIDIHWLLQNGDFKFTLHPGDVPELSTHPSSPTVPTQSEGKFTLHPEDVPELSTHPSSPTV